MIELKTIYRTLFDEYGPQGWWPLVSLADPAAGSSRPACGYHPGDYSYPHDDNGRFEICLGAILTQNTAWKNAGKAIQKLYASDAVDPGRLAALDNAALTEAVRPAGYYNVKARKLRFFADFYRNLAGRTPSRRELLGVWGIGPETADSMLLYAYGKREMVVDAYTRRILAHMGLVEPGIGYDSLKAFCAGGLPHRLEVYQEFHALMVEHAKHQYRQRPYHDSVLQPWRPADGGEA